MGVIRLLLAIAVFNSHFEMTDMPLVDGHEAVLAFFAISGFYMALVLDTAYPGRRSFYMSRFLSLYPLYVLALLVSAALLAGADIHPLTSGKKLLSILSDPVGFMVMAWTSILPLGQELLFSIGQAADGTLHFVEQSRHSIYNNALLIQAWSLSLETVFYVLAPMLVKLGNRALTGLCAASILLRISIQASPASDICFFLRFFPADFWLFGCGILAYRLFRELPAQARKSDYLAFIFLVGLVFVAGAVGRSYEPFILPVAVILALPFVFRAFRSFSLDRVLGKISYPFYLLHYSVIAVFETMADEPVGWQILAVSLVAATTAHAIFNPGIEALKARFRTRSARGSDLAGAYATAAASVSSTTVNP